MQCLPVGVALILGSKYRQQETEEYGDAPKSYQCHDWNTNKDCFVMYILISFAFSKEQTKKFQANTNNKRSMKPQKYVANFMNVTYCLFAFYPLPFRRATGMEKSTQFAKIVLQYTTLYRNW